MTRKKFLMLAGFLVFLSSWATESRAETVEVKMVKSTFIPAVITVQKGDTIRWVNTEELLHTVTSGKAPIPDEKFSSAYVKKEFEVTLDEAGFYDYYCELHKAVMRGVVVVENVEPLP